VKGYSVRQAMARLGVTKAMVHKLIRGNGARQGWSEQGAELRRVQVTPDYAIEAWWIPAKLVHAYDEERGKPKATRT
jgi:hypothetical protein